MSKHAVLLLGWAIVFGVIASTSSAQQNSRVISSVSGSVYSQDTGRPIAGAIVAVVLQGVEVGRAVTDSGGAYLVEGEFRVGGNGEFVRAAAQDFVPEVQQVQLGCSLVIIHDGSGYCRTTVNLHLQGLRSVFEHSAAECIVKGRVVDAEGEAIAGTEVFLYDRSTTVLADETGGFSLGKVGSGLRLVIGRQIGYLPHEKLVLVACPSERHVLNVQLQLFPNPIW